MVRRCAVLVAVCVAAGLGVAAGPASGATERGSAGSDPSALFDLTGSATAGRTPARSHTDRLPAHGSLRVTIPVTPTDRRATTLQPADRVGHYDAWSGTLESDPTSLVSVVRGPDGDSSAYVSTTHGSYLLEGTGDSATWRPARLALPEGPDAIRPPASAGGSTAGSTAGADAGSGDATVSTSGQAAAVSTNRRVDVVVGWTSSAASEATARGTTIASVAAQSVAVSNAAYANSGIALRLNLVGTALATGSQGTDAEDLLVQLRNGSDGKFDNLSALRESKGADLVSLLTDENIGYCGIAYYPVAGGSYGQSVVAESCAVDNLSFPHELGHNVGAAHDRYIEYPNGYYPTYGYGYINLTQRWRTIMSYNNQCADSGFDCTRIARFSSPGARWNNLPTGVANSTDNTRAINTTAAQVAGYRTPSKQEVAVQVAGVGGVASTATAAYLNVTVTGAKASGYVTVYPCGTTRPTTSTVNFAKGTTVANAAVVRLGGGKVCYYASAPTDVIVDVTGQAGGSASGGYQPASPYRVLDTRSNGGALAAGATRAITVTGSAGGNRIPAGSPGAVLNVTSTGAAGSGFLTLYPCGATRPTASTLNVRSAGAIANSTTVALSSSGQVCVYASQKTHVILDIQGAVVASGGSRLTTLSTPQRLLDTRSGSDLAAATTRRVAVTGHAGVPSGAKAVATNLTVVAPAGGGYLTAWPCGTLPTASNVNYLRAETIAGGANPALDATGGLCLRSSQRTDAIVDVAGYYAASGSGIATVTPYRLFDSRYL